MRNVAGQPASLCKGSVFDLFDVSRQDGNLVRVSQRMYRVQIVLLVSLICLIDLDEDEDRYELRVIALTRRWAKGDRRAAYSLRMQITPLIRKGTEVNRLI